MIGLSLVALLVNGGITLSLARHRRDLNFRALLIHNLGDALSNVAILVGALVIRFSGMFWLDPALGLAIGGLVLWSSVGILRESGHILLEGLPRQLQLQEVAAAILGVAGVQEVHDVHIWTLSTDDHLLSCHVRIPDMHMEESEKILKSIQQRLVHDFRIHHVTIQFERVTLASHRPLRFTHPLLDLESGEHPNPASGTFATFSIHAPRPISPAGWMR